MRMLYCAQLASHLRLQESHCTVYNLKIHAPLCPCHTKPTQRQTLPSITSNEFSDRRPLIHVLPTRNLRSLNSAHLRNPSSRWLNLADGTDLIAGIAGNADVVASLESELDVADFEDLGAAFLGVLAGCLEDLVDEGVGNVEDGLLKY